MANHIEVKLAARNIPHIKVGGQDALAIEVWAGQYLP
jgi:hypothetical protein